MSPLYSCCTYHVNPPTAEGKAVVSQNAVRHGLWARPDVVSWEDPAEFEQHREALLAELAPAGAMETMLAERIVGLAWRLQRAQFMQNEAANALVAKPKTTPGGVIRREA